MYDRAEVASQEAVRFSVWPTRSLTWPEAQRVVLGIGLVLGVVGVAFMFAGFPMILPFCGAEVFAIWLAFYFTFRAAEVRQVVTFTPREVVIEKGRHQPESRTAFQRAWVRVTLEQPNSRLRPKRLTVGASGKRIEIGEFLSEDERGQLAKALIHETRQSG